MSMLISGLSRFYTFLFFMSAGVLPLGAGNVQLPLVVYCTESFYDTYAATIQRLVDFPVVLKRFANGPLVALLTHQRREGGGDVVLGLEGEISQDAVFQNSVEPLPRSVLSALKLPFSWSSSSFLPISYSYIAFLSQDPKHKDVRYHGLEDFLSSLSPASMVMPDPRTSMVGRGGLSWIDPHIDPVLAQKVLTYPKGWSGCFSLFNRGKAKVMVGFALSEIYHRAHESGNSKGPVRAIVFQRQPHPLQVITGFVIKKKILHPHALTLMALLLQEGFQREVIKALNYPVTAIPVPLAYERLRPPHAFVLESFSPDRLSQWMRAGYGG